MSEANQIEGYAALIVEDDEATAMAIASVARSLGFLPKVVHCFAEAIAENPAGLPELLLIDLVLPDGDGLDVIAQYKLQGVHDIIVISGTDSQELVTESLRAGARDFLCKPVRLSEIQAVMQRAIMERCDRLPGVAVSAKGAWVAPIRTDTASAAGALLHKSMSGIARQDNFRCLLSGPAGVGKPNVAASIHEMNQCKGELVFVSCAHEIDDAALIRFGGRSAKSGTEAHIGYLAQASNGTLVLDDLSCLPLETQILINNHLESAPEEEACSIIGILREPASAALHEGRLLQELYRNLSVSHLSVPSLTERYQDLGTLANSLVKRLNAANGQEKSVSTQFSERLNQFHWPGNSLQFKQLVNVAYARTGAGEKINPQALILPTPSSAENSPSNNASALVGNSFRDIEIKLLHATLEHTHGNKRQTADLMKISLKTIYNRLSETAEPVAK